MQNLLGYAGSVYYVYIVIKKFAEKYKKQVKKKNQESRTMVPELASTLDRVLGRLRRRLKTRIVFFNSKDYENMLQKTEVTEDFL